MPCVYFLAINTSSVTIIPISVITVRANARSLILGILSYLQLLLLYVLQLLLL